MFASPVSLNLSLDLCSLNLLIIAIRYLLSKGLSEGRAAFVLLVNVVRDFTENPFLSELVNKFWNLALRAVKQLQRRRNWRFATLLGGLVRLVLLLRGWGRIHLIFRLEYEVQV